MKFLYVLAILAVFSSCDDSSEINTCGDGVTDPSEECDLTTQETCQSLGYVTGNVTCGTDCKLIVNCQGRCGNGDLDDGEECDGTIMPETLCSDLDDEYVSGNLSCNSECKFDTGECLTAGCGNGVVDGIEACDGTNLDGKDCSDYGFSAGTLSCSNCQAVTDECYHVFETLKAGAGHMCALDFNGHAWCWGNNEYGQIGDGTITTDRTVPTAVAMPEDVTFVQIAPGGAHTCALDNNQKIWCWGANNMGQVGNGEGGSGEVSLEPTLIAPLDDADFLSVSSGAFHSCGVMTTGGVLCWGGNGQKQISNFSGGFAVTPYQIPGISTSVIVEAGGYFNISTNPSGSMIGWGQNTRGQLGLETPTTVITPNPIMLGNVDIISCGGFHTCIIDTNSLAACWGDNSFGQLGSGLTTPVFSYMPVELDLPSGVTITTIEAGGESHTCALTDDFRIMCWGDNEYGQLGDGYTDDRLSPTFINQEMGLQFISVAPASRSTCTLDSSGHAWCWGDNEFGQLGINSVSPSLVPVQVIMPR
ncbi:hypothetical protein KKF34_00545 [Myxococcota bacterium]|nr:hypothetical protein [Myxococcota bacterium]MBU1379404.1 hypothetical protein [Myxococcota bacterium]MBU1495350.1 hypothetical protein [Myxococcota bacterium]